LNDWHLKLASRSLRRGGVIAYPTEAVFGLGCLPLDYDAVSRILKLKRRAMSKGLIVVAADYRQLHSYVEFPDQDVFERILASWPGPVTWLIPAKKYTPVWLTGSHRTLAVRVSSHPLVRAICSIAGPLVSTSANPGGCLPAKTPARVRSYFRSEIDYILPGSPGPQQNPTEIRVASTGDVVREAHI
jgi:L-threonylcarbamoyladenylate synthase